MIRRSTIWLALLLSPALFAEWRRLGNAAIDLRLSGLATGPIERAGWSADGERIFASAPMGGWMASEDGESWKAALDEPVTQIAGIADRLPEPGATVAGTARAGWLYAAGQHVWRSEDGGRSWRNLTMWKLTSLLGGPARAVAVRPGVAEEIIVAAATGLWKSVDGGTSWSSLNAGLPQLPVRRIVSLPREASGLRVAMLAPATVTPAVFEWAPGERTAWQPVGGVLAVEQEAKAALSREFGALITTIAIGGEVVYAGAADGRVFVSLDRGASWMPPARNEGAAVESFVIDPQEPRRALVALRREGAGPVVLQTTNGGLFWYDISSGIGASAAYGVAADFRSGAVYAATAAGVLWTTTDLTALAIPAPWKKMDGALPEGPVLDVKIDALGQTVYAAVHGHGIFYGAAPHKQSTIRVVSAADWAERPAAPGALVSILGAKLTGVRAGGRPATVLSAGERESQVQLPFDLDGPTVTLALEAGGTIVPTVLPLRPAAPAILVDRDGTPMLMDSATGALIDAQNPSRSGSVLQVLASGLGRVRPDWPAGVAGPAENQPAVVTQVKAWLDGAPVEVVKAVLAPGYVGFYLVEVKLPDVVNAGTSELFLEAGNSTTNRVRLYIEL